MTRWIACLVIVLVGAAAAQDADALDANQLAAFEKLRAKSDLLDLFSACEPPLLYVTLPNGETRSGLTYDRLYTLVERRLRVARLYRVGAVGPPPWPLLRVDVLVYDGDPRRGVYSIKVALRKSVRYFFGAAGVAQTWSKDLLDAFEGDAPVGRILQFVSELVDNFILEYLRVNEAAC